MTSQKNVTTSSESKKQTLPDENRRNMALSMLGLLGGSALLKACAMPTSEETSPDENIATAVQGLVGVEVRWADTVFGSLGPSNRANGDLNKFPANVQNAVIVIVKGAETLGDGGGGIFFWDPSGGTDDGGTVIVPVKSGSGQIGNQGACWRRIYDGPLDTRWFGTSLQSTTSAIQNAINSAATLPGQSGGRVYIPPGKHIITKVIDLKTNVEVFGAGVATVLELNLANLGSASNYDQAVMRARGISNGRISNLKVDGRKDLHSLTNANQQAGIVVSSKDLGIGTLPCSNVVVENCIVTNCAGHGILVNDSVNAQVRGCSTTQNGAGGVLFSSARASGIQSSESVGNAAVGLGTDGALTSGVQIRDCRTDSILIAAPQTSVFGCRVDNTTTQVPGVAIEIIGVANTPTSEVSVANCYIYTAGVGITVTGAVTNLDSLKNIINGNKIVLKFGSDVGIDLAFQRDTCVINNSISGAGSFGIRNVNGKNVSICDNVMSNAAGSGIKGVLLDSSTETAVSGNTINGYNVALFEDNSDFNLIAGNVFRPNTMKSVKTGGNTIFEHNIQ